MTLVNELDNLQQLAQSFTPTPGDIPHVSGIDMFGGTLALNGSLGGDLIVYLDFKRVFDLDIRTRRALEAGRTDVAENLGACRGKAGVALVDVSGHRMTDALLAAALHHGFRIGAIYELDMFGEVTSRLFENLNTQLCQSWAENKFASLIYGEISEAGHFRFLCAAAPAPLVFSRRYDRFMDVEQDLCVSFPPLGIVPSQEMTGRNGVSTELGVKDDYTVNQWVLMGQGDILLMHTDGLAEHRRPGEAYCPFHLEQKLREVKDGSAQDIFDAVAADLQRFSDPRDDISFVVIKRTTSSLA